MSTTPIAGTVRQFPSMMNARTAGLTLLEVLIALLVLSIGLVGMASLQLMSLQSAHSSYYRSLASAAALDTEERMWIQLRETVLDNPATAPLCMTATDIQGVITESQAAWRPTTAGGVSNAGIPNLQITTNVDDDNDGRDDEEREDTSNVATNWVYAWQEIPIRLTWTEGRFGDGGVGDDGQAQSFVESFDYVIRIPCVSDIQQT